MKMNEDMKGPTLPQKHAVTIGSQS